MQTFELVNKAFSHQSFVFDDYESGNVILKWMRSVTRLHLLRYLNAGDKILELNSGTGLDAVFLAEKGYRVHCIDIAEGMLNKLDEKIKIKELQEKISFQELSFTNLNNLEEKSFDYIFSNFGGLNCAENLSSVFSQFSEILKPGGKVTLIIIPPICPWEIALAFKGNFKTAFRRFHKKGIEANVEGIKFQTYYYTVSDAQKALGNQFKLIELQGLASFSPPPYMENFPKKFPVFYRYLKRLDNRLSHNFPFNRCADHFILTAEYNPQ